MADRVRDRLRVAAEGARRKLGEVAAGANARLGPRAPVVVLAAAALLLISGGALIVARHQLAIPRLNVRIAPNNIAPALALRTLAGEVETTVLDEALEDGQLDTALATLYNSTTLSNMQRANYWIVLAQRYYQAKDKKNAQLCYSQASNVLLLSADAYDSTKATSFLTIGKDLRVLGAKPEAERNDDYAYTIVRYSLYVADGDRRFVLNGLTSEYKELGADRKADETIRAQASLPPYFPPPTSPAVVNLPPAPLGPEVTAATAWRQRAAQRLINSLGGNSRSNIEDARKRLEEALVAEDDLRAAALEGRRGQTASLAEQAALTQSRTEWQSIKQRTAAKQYGMTLVPSWERQQSAISEEMRQAVSNMFLVRLAMAAGLPDPIDAAQARLDLLREQIMWGRNGLYPDYPENRLVAELAQATKDRIDLREDGLYVAVLSQQGSGLYVITIADLWGRPAAMASAGLGMSFPTVRSSSAYVPAVATALPTIVPTLVAARTPTPPRSGTPTLAPGVQPTTPATGPAAPPTQPVSPLPTPSMPPVAMATPTRPPAQPTIPLLPTQPLPTLPVGPGTVPIPTLPQQPTVTPTPAYNYQVIYQSGPTQQQDTGYDNLHIAGMIVDQSGILISGLKTRLSWCCPAGEAIHPRPTIDVDNGRFDFFVGRGQFNVSVVDGNATTQPVSINSDVPMSGYVEWVVTFQRTNKGLPSGATLTPTVTPTASPAPASPTPPLPGAISVRLGLAVGWNFITLPLLPVQPYTAQSLQNEINSQIYSQGNGVSQVASWDGSRIVSYVGSINMGAGYFVNITGTNSTSWLMTGYPLVSPVTLNLSANQKNSIGLPYMGGQVRSAAQLAEDVNRAGGAGAFVRLWRMRDTAGNWEYYDGSGVGVPSFQLQLDRGYLLEVTRSFSWAPWQGNTPTPTPSATGTPTITPTASPTPYDTYEPNASFAQAAPMGAEIPVISYVSYPNDKDYYKFQVTAPSTLYLSLTNLPADYDLYLFNTQFSPVGYSAYGGLTAEFITSTVTTAGEYYALVQGAGPVYDTIKPYKLLLTYTPQ